MRYLSIIVISLIVLDSISSVYAAESSLMVVLPKQIQESYSNIGKVNSDGNKRISYLENSIKNIAEKIQHAQSQAERHMLQKQYLGARAEALKVHASMWDTIESELKSVVPKMQQLEKISRDGSSFGLGAGINPEDEVAKAAVSSMLKGFSGMLGMVQQLSPESNLNNHFRSLSAMDEAAKRFYNKDRSVSFQDQQRLAVEGLVLAGAVKNILLTEHDYLLEKLYYIDTKNIVHIIESISADIDGGADVISTGFKGYHDTDERVFRDNFSYNTGRVSYSHPKLKGVGVFAQ